MPARDIFHEAVKNALIKDGWAITDDPLTLAWKKKTYFVDLAAERLLAAERWGRRIAVEVKSFVNPSEAHDLHNALGQYQVYHSILNRTHPETSLYLAIPGEVYESLFLDEIGSLLLEDYDLRIIVFDERQEVILKWIS